MGVINLQSRTPRHRSLRHFLSNVMWTRGISAFFDGEVPFSFSNSDYMADWVFTLAKRIGLGKRSFRIKEYGAGLGVLARGVIQRISDLNLRSDWGYCISEYSDQSVITHKSVFATPPESVTFVVEDIVRSSVKPASQDLIVINYLIDSLPATHLQWDGTRLKEIYVKSGVRDSECLIDSVHYPPSYVDANDLANWVQSLSLVEAAFVAPTLAARVAESFSLGTVTSLTTDEIETVITFLNESVHPHKRFNFPLGLFGLLDRLWNELSDTGAVWIFDVAAANSGDYDGLTVMFRGIVCYPIYTELLCWYWTLKGGICETSTVRSGMPIGIVLSKSHCVDRGELDALCDPRLVDFGDLLENRLDEVNRDDPDRLKKLETIEQLIPREIITDYHVGMHMALKWNQFGHYGRALDWLAPIFKRYKSMAISTQTLAARCYKMLGNMTEAKHRLLDVLLVAPDCAYAYKELSLIALKEKDWDRFLNLSIQSVQHGNQDVPWNVLLTIGLLKIQARQFDDARSILVHIATQVRLFPQEFNSDFYERVKSALDLLDAPGHVTL